MSNPPAATGGRAVGTGVEDEETGREVVDVEEIEEEEENGAGGACDGDGLGETAVGNRFVLDPEEPVDGA